MWKVVLGVGGATILAASALGNQQRLDGIPFADHQPIQAQEQQQVRRILLLALTRLLGHGVRNLSAWLPCRRCRRPMPGT
jgi:hypothetical protein